MVWSRILRCRSYNSRIGVEGLEASDCRVFSVRFFEVVFFLLFCCAFVEIPADSASFTHTEVSLKFTRGAMLDVRTLTVVDGFKLHRCRVFEDQVCLLMFGVSGFVLQHC